MSRVSPPQKMVVQPTHDTEVYLKENRYDRPKEIFKVLATRAQQSGVLQEGSVVCDFGCAAGEFLYVLHRRYPQATYYGYDTDLELLQKARARVPGIEFRVGSVLDRALWPPASIDMAFMVGVHSLFDEFEPVFKNLLKWTRRGGRIDIVGLFNPYPVDVWVKYRLVNDPVREHREPGWNIFSKASVSQYLDATLGPGKHRFTPFELSFDLAPNPQDAVRTWTFRDSRNRRLLTNGLSLLCNIEMLEIQP